MNKVLLPSKRNTEVLKQPFNFASQLSSGETISTAATTVVVYRGVDASPSSVLSGGSSISGTGVTQGLQGGVDGVVYIVTCQITTSLGQTLTQWGYMAVFA